MDIEITINNRTPLESVTGRQGLKSRNEGGGLGVGDDWHERIMVMTSLRIWSPWAGTQLDLELC